MKNKETMRYLFKNKLPSLATMTLLTSSLVFTGCNKLYNISVKPDSLYFSSEDSTSQYVEVAASYGGWFVSRVDPFLSVDPKSGTSKTLKVRIAEPIPSNSSRKGLIVISPLEEPDNTTIITVYQGGER